MGGRDRGSSQPPETPPGSTTELAAESCEILSRLNSTVASIQITVQFSTPPPLPKNKKKKKKKRK